MLLFLACGPTNVFASGLVVDRKIVMARLDLPLRLLEEVLGGGEACRTCHVCPRHEIVELLLEIFEPAQAGHAPRLAEAVLKNLGLMGMLRDSLKAHIEIEGLVNRRRNTGQQRTHARKPFIASFLLQDGPCRHGAENDRGDNECSLPQPESLQPLK